MIAEVTISNFWAGMTLGFICGAVTIILVAIAVGKR